MFSLVNPPRLALGDADDADSRDDQQVEGGRADDGAGAELAGLEGVLDDLDAGEEDLGRRGAERHEGEVGDGAVPDGHLDDLGLVLLGGGDVDLLGLGGDLLDGAHEHVGDDLDAEEGVEEADEVERRPRFPRPRPLEEEGQDDADPRRALVDLPALGLVLGPGIVLVVLPTQGGLVFRPRAIADGRNVTHLDGSEIHSLDRNFSGSSQVSTHPIHKTMDMSQLENFIFSIDTVPSTDLPPHRTKQN